MRCVRMSRPRPSGCPAPKRELAPQCANTRSRGAREGKFPRAQSYRRTISTGLVTADLETTDVTNTLEIAMSGDW